MRSTLGLRHFATRTHMQVKAIPEVWQHPEPAQHGWAAARKTGDTQKKMTGRPDEAGMKP